MCDSVAIWRLEKSLRFEFGVEGNIELIDKEGKLIEYDRYNLQSKYRLREVLPVLYV